MLALFCSVIVGLVDNVVRPWVISGRAEMGGLVVFISVLGGISAFGLLGVVRRADRGGHGGQFAGPLRAELHTAGNIGAQRMGRQSAPC